MKVFSFCIFGSADKYLKGLLKNIEIIDTQFPDFYIYIYVGDDITDEFINTHLTRERIIVIKTGLSGLINTAHRFFPIDNPEVELMFVRDTDSRIHTRDIKFINEFISTLHKSHIIRDHHNHCWPIMAGMWGLKKGAVQGSIKDMYDEYYKTAEIEYGTDQDFLAKFIYPIIANDALVHTSCYTFLPEQYVIMVDDPVIDHNFVGNVVDFNEDGTEFNTCPYF